jgi:hypothetical protein
MKGECLSEATSADPLDQTAVDHEGLFSSSISCFLGCMSCIFRCLMPKLSITGGSNNEILSLLYSCDLEMRESKQEAGRPS